MVIKLTRHLWLWPGWLKVCAWHCKPLATFSGIFNLLAQCLQVSSRIYGAVTGQAFNNWALADSLPSNYWSIIGPEQLRAPMLAPHRLSLWFVQLSLGFHSGGFVKEFTGSVIEKLFRWQHVKNKGSIILHQKNTKRFKYISVFVQEFISS